MFETITDVPAKLAEFYTSEMVEQPTGNTFEETFTYEGEDGRTYTGTRTVAEMQTVELVSLLPFDEAKTLADVWQVVTIHKGKRDDLIRLFLGMVNEGFRQLFYFKYRDWYLSKPTPEEERFSVFDDAGVAQFVQALYDDALVMWQAQEPADYETLNIDQWFLDNAQELRKLAYPSREEQMEMQFNDMMNGTTTWQEAIMSINLQYPLPS